MTTGDIEKDLKLNYKEFLASGNDEIAKERYNSAISAYFKSIVVLCDLRIYQIKRLLPKNHSERFLFLNIHFKEAGNLVSNLFNKYTESYNFRMTKKDALLLKENVEKIKNLLGFKETL